MRYITIPLLVAAACSALTRNANADEGIWTVDNFPARQVEDRYGFEVTPQWLERVRLATVRLQRCTASFVSPQGLMLTSQHCAASCLAQRSSREESLLESGFLAQARSNELRCSTQAADVLVDLEDVTEEVQAATGNLGDEYADEVRKRTLTELEQRCEQAARRSGSPLKCEAVTLYGGGRYSLYKYRHYDDVRLVFAPEAGIARFGGAADTFEFPRWDLDFALLRAYEHGRPAATPDHLWIDFTGPMDGELVFVSGHPGATDRLTTSAQLETLRDAQLPSALLRAAELRGRYSQFSKTGAGAARIAQEPLDVLEDDMKARRKMLDALLDGSLIRARSGEDEQLREFAHSHEQLHEPLADPFGRIDEAQAVARAMSLSYSFIEDGAGFDSRLFRYARMLVRAATERQKPNAERLREYTDSALTQIEQELRADVPVYPELERLTLSLSLQRMQERLGPDNALVHRLLAAQSPDSLAGSLVSRSRLADPDVRMALWNGGESAVEASDDPMIALARSVDGEAREIRKRYEEKVEAPVDVAGEQISKVRFAAHGTRVYPDGTLTLRISFGTVRGWIESGLLVDPLTRLGRLFDRATGYPPFAVPPTWLAARDELDMTTPFNLVTDNDIVNGDSGSPLIDAQGNIVGVVFDGNIHSIAGTFRYDKERNRAIAVHPAVILEALTKVYHARALLDELGSAH